MAKCIDEFHRSSRVADAVGGVAFLAGWCGFLFPFGLVLSIATVPLVTGATVRRTLNSALESSLTVGWLAAGAVLGLVSLAAWGLRSILMARAVR